MPAEQQETSYSITPSYERISDYLGDNERYDIWSRRRRASTSLTVSTIIAVRYGRREFSAVYADSVKPDKADVLEVGSERQAKRLTSD